MLKIREGENIQLNSLEKKLMERISVPMPEVCPVSLRYELAKYDSEEVKQAYNNIYKLYESGHFDEE